MQHKRVSGTAMTVEGISGRHGRHRKVGAAMAESN